MTGEVRIPRQAIAWGLTVLLISAFLIVPGPRDAVAARLAEVTDPRVIADASTLAAHRAAAERAVAASHAKALDQLRKVLELRLAITRQQAEAIVAKARSDLAAIRRTAFIALAQATALSGPALETYVAEAEARSDRGIEVGEAGVLLAPALGEIVLRAAQLSSQVADGATRDLTGAAPSPSPSPAPRTPSPSPR